MLQPVGQLQSVGQWYARPAWAVKQTRGEMTGGALRPWYNPTAAKPVAPKGEPCL